MRTALVTGASSGMGRETAKKLLEEGFTVYAVARRVERMRDLEQLGAVRLRMDITEDEDITAVVERILCAPGWGRRSGQQCWLRHVRRDGGHRRR
ncbi:SDR family NAD(P)-dependent oxidoreductase [Streptomyces sp. NPDC054833]